MGAEHVFHRFDAGPAARRRPRRRHPPDRRRTAAATSTPAAERRCRALATAIPRSPRRSPSRRRAWNIVHTGFFTTEAAEELAAMIVEMSPGSLDRVWYTSSGSEAIEAALKLARQYHLERGDAARKHVIARRLSYHGNTLGALAAGGSAWRRAPYAAVAHRRRAGRSRASNIASPSRARAPKLMARRAADALEQEMLRLGPDTVIAFVAETVVGATAGAVPPVPGYLQQGPRDLRPPWRPADPRRSDVRLAAGPAPFLSCEQDEVVPDIVTLGKGLGAGYPADRRGHLHKPKSMTPSRAARAR